MKFEVVNVHLINRAETSRLDRAGEITGREVFAGKIKLPRATHKRVVSSGLRSDQGVKKSLKTGTLCRSTSLMFVNLIERFAAYPLLSESPQMIPHGVTQCRP